MAHPASHQSHSSVPARPRLALGIAIGIFVLTFLVFIRIVFCDFVMWDEDINIYNNPHMQTLNAAELKWMFTDNAYIMRYQPLTWLAHALVHSVCGFRPAWYKSLNLFFHCANAVLLFVVLRRLLEFGWRNATAPPPRDAIVSAAGLGALLWALHPMRVEPVVLIPGVGYLCAMFFTLVSLMFYLCALRRAEAGKSGRASYWASVAAFGVTMLFYPVVCAYAVALVPLDYYLRRFDRIPGKGHISTVSRVLLEKLPFVALACLILLSLLARLQPQSSFMSKPDIGHGYFAKAMQLFYVWAYYLWKPWAPFNLSPVYTTLVDFNPTDLRFINSAVAITGLTALFIWKWRKWPLAITLWLCYLVLLIPVSGLTENPHYTGDRYSYFSGVVWSILIAAAITKVWNRARLRAWIMGLSLGIAVLLGGAAFHQIRIWRNSEVLFTYMIEKLGSDPYRSDIMWRLGSYYYHQHRLDDAIREYTRSIEIDPFVPNVYNLRGSAYGDRGEHQLALQDFCNALKLDPNFIPARCKSALARYYLKDYEGAWIDVAAARKLNGSFPPGFLEALKKDSGRP